MAEAAVSKPEILFLKVQFDHHYGSAGMNTSRNLSLRENADATRRACDVMKWRQPPFCAMREALSP